MAEHFTCFVTKKYSNYCLKTWEEQQEYNLMDDLCYLKNICETKHPLTYLDLAKKQANRDGNLIKGDSINYLIYNLALA